LATLPVATAAPAPVLSKRLDLALKITLSLASVLLPLGLLEGLAYAWERAQADGLYAWELVASRRMVWEYFPEPGAGYSRMKPDSHYEWQGIAVDINAHGLRGPETAYAKPPGTFRILNLGDSVAMGWGVEEAATYGRRLEERLNGAGGRHYEVINAGVPGWNLENALAYLEAEGLRYEPDLILLDVTLANDINGRSALQAAGQPSALDWLRSNTYAWPFLSVQFYTVQARAAGRERIDTLSPPTNPAKYFPQDPGSDRWSRVWNAVAGMQRLAAANGAGFGMILFPLEFQVLDEGFPALPQELLAARAAEAGIPALDLLPAFRQACLEKPGGPCQLEDRYLFADVWMHPSSLGHALTAAEVERELGDLFPE
jgi:hypothetical protein